MKSVPQIHRLVCILFVVIASGAWGLAKLRVGSRGAWGIALELALGAVMFAAWQTSTKGSDDDHRWTLGAGLLALAIVGPIDVSAVHDVQRYLWDGAVFNAGLDPYRVAPVALQAASLRAVWQTPLEHVAYSTIYPPGAIFLFGLATRLGPTAAPQIWKALVVAAAAGTLWLGARALREMGRARHLPLLAFSPVLLTEAATGAHLDVICALAVAASLLCTVRRRAGWAGAALGLGALVKLLPAMAVLPLAVSVGRGARLRLLASAFGVVAAGYCAAFAYGLTPIGSLPTFIDKWRFGSPVFSVLTSLLTGTHALRVALLLTAIGLLVAIWLARSSWVDSISFAMMAPLWVSPVVFPWYLVPVVPIVALAPSAFALGWMTTLPLTDEVTDRFEAAGVWHPAGWPLWIIGLSWLLGISIDFVRSRRMRTRCAERAPTPFLTVSVIVPVLNEEAGIGQQLESLGSVAALHEIVVVDGGSSDRTAEIVRSHDGIQLVTSPRGRARQMNRGAEQATGDVLLFLHADVRLPERAVWWIRQTLVDGAVVAGAFRTWTVPDRKTSLGPLLHLADLRSRYTSLPYGDQALFVRASIFRALGGFPDQPLMEDLELSRRLRRAGRVQTVPACVRVSGRRFVTRPVYYTLLVNVFPLLYRLGVSPQVLANLYRDAR